MAIQYKLVNTHTTNPTGSIIYLEDSTGTYDAILNPGGYGTPNIDRASIALFIKGYYISTKNSLPITFNTYDPLVVSSFSANISVDGWYKFTMLSFPIYDPNKLQNYPPGNIYYDSTNSVLVKVISEPGNNDNIIYPIAFDTTDTTMYEVAYSEELIPYTNSGIKIKLQSQISDLLTNNVDFTDKRLIRLKDNYNAVRIILQGALYEFCRGNKYTAQKSIEFLNTNNYVSE